MRRKIADHEKIERRQKQKILSFGAFLGCFILAVHVYTVLKPYLGPRPIHFSVKSMNRKTPKSSSSRSGDHMEPNIRKYWNFRSDVYEIKGDIRIQGVSSTIFVASRRKEMNSSTSYHIKPYPRKDNYGAMKRVTRFKIIRKTADKSPRCSRYHSNTTAILFSVGGLTRNHFHSFADVLVPLFLTSHQFNRKTIFLVANYKFNWTFKYKAIIEKLSKHYVHAIDKENEVLCFSRMIVGLKAQKDLEIVPSESTNFSRRNFTKLLQLDIVPRHDRHQPRLLIVSRTENRKLKNEREVRDMARSLGFDAVVKKMSSNLSFNAQLVNSFDVLVGVHGAGLTNLLFLRENAVLIQIVPFGLNFLARVCFEGSVESSKLKYIRYNVNLNESSLLGRYPPNSQIYTNPDSIISGNFQYFSSIYLYNQDVNLDLYRFRETLLRALELVRTN